MIYLQDDKVRQTGDSRAVTWDAVIGKDISPNLRGLGKCSDAGN
jgi:hypothetical protein